MKYEKIWNKVLGENEKVEFEFTIGDGYIVLGIIVWAIISLFSLLIGKAVAFWVFAIALFYYGYYKKAANAYAFTGKRILIHRGWLSTRLVSIDYSKITDIHVFEPFLDRILTHTGNIAVESAGKASLFVLQNVSNPYEIKKKLDSLKDKNGIDSNKN